MKFLTLMMAAVVGFATSSTAMAAEKTLSELHSGLWPVSQDGFVTKSQCMKCHGTYEELAKKTSIYNINPHESHLGEVNCEECHKVNKAKPELMCNSCHKFDIRKK